MRTSRICETDYERYIITRAKAHGLSRAQLAAALGITTGTLKTRLARRHEWLPVECRKLAEALHLTDMETLYLTVHRVPLDDGTLDDQEIGFVHCTPLHKIGEED